MEEELIKLTTEDVVELELEEVVESEANIEDLDQNIGADVSIEVAEIVPTEEIEIEIDESVGWVGGDNGSHYDLSGRDEPNQHPIKSIIGLKDKLDEEKTLKTVYSDKFGLANYYKWDSGAYNDYGYFVSLTSANTISICDGANIFGVTVNDAGFVGGQQELISEETDEYGIPKHVYITDNTYALVVTTGLVDVRCESTVAVGDYVISNAHGVAATTDSGCGYKVVAIEKKHGVDYAVISLGVQACTTDLLDRKVQRLGERMGSAEINITSAINVANQAYSKSSECDNVSQEAIIKALEAIKKADEAVEKSDETTDALVSVSGTAAQARVIAESAVTSAEKVREDAYQATNEAWAKANEVQNEVISLCAHIDKYVVGEFSQAYGLTLEQARSILKKDMIYIPLKSAKDGEPTYTHTESYTYTDDNGDQQTLNTLFLCGFNYIWDGFQWNASHNKCVALPYIDGLENNVPIGGDVIKFWFVDSEIAPDGYEPMTLYIWTKITSETGDVWQWEKVNTLAGNSSSRIASMIRQDVDEVRAEVVNAYGAVAGFGAKLGETEAKVNSIASWPNDDGTHHMALLEQKVDADGNPYMVLATVRNVGSDSDTGTVEELGGAKIVLQDAEDGSYIQIEADNINFEGYASFTTTDGKITSINGDMIKTGAIESNGYDDGDDAVYSTVGTRFNLDDGSITSQNFSIDSAGKAYFKGDLEAPGGNMGGWNIDESRIHKNGVGLKSCKRDGDFNVIEQSLVNPTIEGQNGEKQRNYQLICFYAGAEGDLTSSPFKVLEDGSLYASAVKLGSGYLGRDSTLFLGTTDIAGSANFFEDALKDDGTRADNAINNWRMTVGSHFGVTSDGSLYASAVKLGSGTIGSDKSLLLNTTDMAGVEGFFDGTSINNWRMTVGSHFGVTSDGSLYASAGKIGGWSLSGTELVNYSGTKDADGYYPNSFCMQTAGDNAVNALAIGKAKEDTWSNAAFRVTVDGAMYATAGEIGGFTIEDHSLTWIDDDVAITPEIRIEVHSSTNEMVDKGSVRITNRGIECYRYGDLELAKFELGKLMFGDAIGNASVLFDDGAATLSGTWYGTSGSAIKSDRNAKNSIQNVTHFYEVIFDNLQPKIFKYNDGTSDRYHTGFIAQEVDEAIQKARLTRKDFAAVCIHNEGTEKESWGLRYDEFVSLNTWQIQKLKARVTELEERIAKLENK